MSVSPELSALLARLGLQQYVATFEEEAITELPLLTSMGDAMLRENLDELGMEAADAETLATALFPPAPAAEEEDDDGLELEDNAGGAADGGPHLEPNAPARLDAEERAEAEEVAAQLDWLDKPLATLDPHEAKRLFLEARDEALGYQRRGQLSNAVAAYTRALALEVPNAKANAAALYNRAACRHGLGQLHQALADAQQAAQTDPAWAGAWWRAADAALALGDARAAAAAVERGLAADPTSAPLLALRKRVAVAA